MQFRTIGVIAATIILVIIPSLPTFAAKEPLNDEYMDDVYGNSNDFILSGNTSMTISLSGDTNSNIQIGKFQWSDKHVADQSLNKNANDQSGSDSQVQKDFNGQANALFVGSVSQSVLLNNGGNVNGSQKVSSIAVGSSSGF